MNTDDNTAAPSTPTLWWRLSRFLWRMFLGCINVYAVVLVLHLLLWLLFGERLGWVTLLNQVIHWLLLPSLVLLPLAVWRRLRLASNLLSICVITFLLVFGELFIPQLSGPDQPDLRVMTFNTGATMSDGEPLVEIVRSSGADIVGILELSADNVDTIEQELIDLYPYQALYGLGIPGIGLLSRYPIIEQEIFYLQAQRLPHLRAVMELDGVGATGASAELTIVVCHTPPPQLYFGGMRAHPASTSEIETLAQMVANAKPAILIGDLNIVDQAEAYSLLVDADLNDAFRQAGWGFGSTWPLGGWTIVPVVRIDYIWYTAEFDVARCWVGSTSGSDHLPVLADLALHNNK